MTLENTRVERDGQRSCRTCRRDRRRVRYHAAAEYRERQLRDTAARMATPEARERAAVRRRERRLTDPDYRERMNAQARARYPQQRDSARLTRER